MEDQRPRYTQDTRGQAPGPASGARQPVFRSWHPAASCVSSQGLSFFICTGGHKEKTSFIGPLGQDWMTACRQATLLSLMPSQLLLGPSALIPEGQGRKWPMDRDPGILGGLAEDSDPCGQATK